jgi:hypothetical protein
LALPFLDHALPTNPFEAPMQLERLVRQQLRAVCQTRFAARRR